MSILDKWLAKKGVEKIEDLSLDERATYDKYRLVLSGELVTIDSLKAFCKNQLAVIIAACDGKTPITSIQQAGIHIYSNIIKAIEAPEAERASLERMLEQELK